MTVDILGTRYTIRRDADPAKDKELGNGELLGYCMPLRKLIVSADLTKIDNWKNMGSEAIATQTRETLRHEIIHAFLHESGLWGSSLATESWATNEEMTDWFAMQWPKLMKVMEKAGCL